MAGSSRGQLFLVPTPVGNLEDITKRALRIMAEADTILAEDTRNTGVLLQQYGIKTKLLSYHKFNERQRLPRILALLDEGQTLALVSDAGTPGLSDPGSILVKGVLGAGYTVSALPGPSALLPAVTMAGLPAEPLLYMGFLPEKNKDREPIWEILHHYNGTAAFYESPHNLVKTLAAIAENLGDISCVLVREISKIHEEMVSGSVMELFARYQNEAPRGEFVVLLPPRAGQEINVDSELLKLIELGVERETAISILQMYGRISRNQAYKLKIDR